MLTFLRKIRRSLIETGSARKPASPAGRYLLYAIGEIALVVIGILIALQINNWNELKKDRKIEKQFLEGIRADLCKDSLDLDRLIHSHDVKLAYYKLVDPEFKSRWNLSNINTDTISIDTTLHFAQLFDRGRSYRSNSGTYSSMISDGQSQLITNRELFNEFQNIYTVAIPHLTSVYETLKEKEKQISWKWARELRYPTYKYMSQIKDKDLIADLYYLHNYRVLYSNLLRGQQQNITQAIHQIEEELNR